MKKILSSMIICGLLGAAGASASDRDAKLAAEADERLAQFEQTGDVTSCLQIRRIDHIRPLDERRFLVEVGYKDYYLTEMSGKCHNATRSNYRIQYSTSQSSVCNNDIVRIVDNSTGMMAGSCSFGKFERLEKKPKDAS